MIFLPTLFGIILGAGVNALSDWLPTLRGRPTSLSYSRPRGWVILGLSIISAIFLWERMGGGMPYFVALLLLLYLGTIAIVDLEHSIILIQTTYLGVVVCGVVGLTLRGISATLLGGLGGLGLLYSFQLLGTSYMRYVAKRRGGQYSGVAIGWGDVFLGSVLGLLLGWPGIGIGLVRAVFAGAAVIPLLIFRILRGTFNTQDGLPYAPFLVLGALGALYWELLA